MAEKELIGKVKHYFDKISVAVIELKGELKTGDKIEIVTAEGPFQQEVDSMQIEHNKIEEANKGDAIGMKVDNPVKDGNEVFLVKE